MQYKSCDNACILRMSISKIGFDPLRDVNSAFTNDWTKYST